MDVPRALKLPGYRVLGNSSWVAAQRLPIYSTLAG